MPADPDAPARRSILKTLRRCGVGRDARDCPLALTEAVLRGLALDGLAVVTKETADG